MTAAGQDGERLVRQKAWEAVREVLAREPWRDGVSALNRLGLDVLAAELATAVAPDIAADAERRVLDRCAAELVQVGWLGPYGVIPGGMNNEPPDPAWGWQPLYVRRLSSGRAPADDEEQR